MSAALAFLWLLFLCAAAAAGAGALVAALLSSVKWAATAPSARARRAMLVASLPWLLAITSAVSVFAIAAAKPLGIVADHCLYHGPGHPHLCLAHLPAITVGWPQALIAMALLLPVTLIAIRRRRADRRMAAQLASMRRLARGHGRLRILDDDRCVALAADAGEPFVLFSRGLLARLTRRERRIVLAHEVAHLRGGDLRRNALFEKLLLLHLPRTANELRREWRQALEEAADDRVAGRFGAAAVAGTLARVLRVKSNDSALAMAIGDADPLRRIERLLAPAATPVRSRVVESCCALLLLSLPVVVTTAHHALETLLGFLAAG